MKFALSLLKDAVFLIISVFTFYAIQIFLMFVQLISFRGHSFDIVTLYVAINRMLWSSLQFHSQVFIGILIFLFSIYIIRKFNINNNLNIVVVIFGLYYIFVSLLTWKLIDEKGGTGKMKFVIRISETALR